MLLKNLYIDFLVLEKIGTLKKLLTNEVYVYVRVVLTRLDLYTDSKRFVSEKVRFLCPHVPYVNPDTIHTGMDRI